MRKLSDEELIEEIRQRFEFNHNALADLQALTQKLEQMNERLKESEALKSQFLSNIRNEINNPLSAIMGLSGQCLSRNQNHEVCIKTARMIYSEAFSLDFQLQNIFIAAELEAGDAVPSYAQVELASVLDGCLEKLLYRVEEKKLQLETTVPEGLVFATDAQKVETILMNLLANAVEFCDAGGKVEVQVGLEPDGRLQIAVSDNGPGIPPKYQEFIFDRFRQIEVGSTKGHRGHGLGLSICWSIIELLGGEINLDSQPGEGSRFVLILPQVDTEVKTQAKDANFFLFDKEDSETEQF
ncbi:MAG: HAMP domain-containing histidine kinase [Desulfuromonadales bacterium]|nr:HAMP domain-containing histidine kinase [Desulfuromonadales bacterium]